MTQHNMDLFKAELAYHTLKTEHIITDDNVSDYRYAMSFRDEYAAMVKVQSNIIVETIKMGQSFIAMGELMRELYNASHKTDVMGNEHDLPGVEHFLIACEIASQAIDYIVDVTRIQEEFAAASLSCASTVDVSYI